MPKECTQISREYGLKVVKPDDTERTHTPVNGYVALAERYLQFGVRFPLHPFFVEVLEYFGLTVFQISQRMGPHDWTLQPIRGAWDGSAHNRGVRLVLLGYLHINNIYLHIYE